MPVPASITMVPAMMSALGSTPNSLMALRAARVICTPAWIEFTLMLSGDCASSPATPMDTLAGANQSRTSTKMLTPGTTALNSTESAGCGMTARMTPSDIRVTTEVLSPGVPLSSSRKSPAVEKVIVMGMSSSASDGGPGPPFPSG